MNRIDWKSAYAAARQRRRKGAALQGEPADSCLLARERGREVWRWSQVRKLMERSLASVQDAVESQTPA